MHSTEFRQVAGNLNMERSNGTRRGVSNVELILVFYFMRLTRLNMEPAQVVELIDAKVNLSQYRLLTDLDNLISTRLTSVQQNINDSHKSLSDVQVAKIEEMNMYRYLQISTERKRRAIQSKR